jgi:hypothetical protein
MPPISKERLEWIEARLFILARTLGVLNEKGYTYAQRVKDSNHVYLTQAAADLQAERILLMAEREAIEVYLNEEGAK